MKGEVYTPAKERNSGRAEEKIRELERVEDVTLRPRIESFLANNY